MLAAWIGLQINPQPLPLISSREELATGTLPLPQDLPVPVKRFYTQIYGDSIPIIDSVIINGRGTMRVIGITLPVRFQFIHDTGHSYRHYIEATFFGIPIMKINETYIDGVGRMELPFGVSEGQKINQGANLALWAEAIWMPSVWITNPDVQWAPIDDYTALLIVPFDDSDEYITVYFDPQTGLLNRMESMRYKGEESEEKILWINQVIKWDYIDGRLAPVMTAITWQDEDKPWAILTTEKIAYNKNVEMLINTNNN